MSRRRRCPYLSRYVARTMAREWLRRCRGYADEAAPRVYDHQPRRGHSPPRLLFRAGYTNRAPRGSCSGRNGGSSSPSTASFITKVRLSFSLSLAFSSLWNYVSRSFRRETVPIFFSSTFSLLSFSLWPFVFETTQDTIPNAKWNTRLVILVVSLRIPTYFFFSLLSHLSFFLFLSVNFYLVVIVNANEKDLFSRWVESVQVVSSPELACLFPAIVPRINF